MKVAIEQGGKKKLLLEADHIGLKAPKDGAPLMIEAEIEEGSPIMIMIGSQRPPVPIRSLRLIHSKMYRVAAFKRHTKSGVVLVPGHMRRMPVRLRTIHKSI